MSGVQSIERAFALLRAVAVEPAGVTDLADRTDLPKSTAARLLAALATEGAVEQSADGSEYRLGRGLLEFARAIVPDPSLIAAARPFLTMLSAETGETAALSVLDDCEVRWLDDVLPDEDVMIRSWVGEVTPFNVVPSGIALVSGLAPSEIATFLDGPLVRHTERSLVEPERLRQRIDELRDRGSVWAFGEFDDGINSVAAPVIDGRGRTVAAINVHGPAYRFPPDGAADSVSELLRSTAEQLSARLA